MKQKKSVFLLVGPRGSGKSYYAKKLIESQPDMEVISRDEIFVKLFGTVYVDSIYAANQGADEIDRVLQEKLKREGARIILDHWTNATKARQALIGTLRKCGADLIVALFFTTPIDLVKQWFWQKPEVGRLGEAETRRDTNLAFFPDNEPEYEYERFHRFATGIDNEGFDRVIRVDPTANTIRLD